MNKIKNHRLKTAIVATAVLAPVLASAQNPAVATFQAEAVSLAADAATVIALALGLALLLFATRFLWRTFKGIR